MPADIPPPSEADLKVSLMQCYKYYTIPNNARLYANDLEAILIRRCHAAEAECDRLRAELAEAVRLLEPFAAVWSEEGLVLHCGDCKAAAAFVAKHKGNA